MENHYENKFELSLPFSIHNGVVVIENSKSFVKFGVRNSRDLSLKKQLEKAWASYARKNYFSENSENLEAGKIEFVELSKEELDKAILKNYGQSGNLSRRTEKSGAENSGTNESEKKAVALLFDSLLSEALGRQATDIHIEEKCVRFRVNGLLEKICELSVERSVELVRRVKILSNLDVMENRRGQDGQFVSELEDKNGGKTCVFVRVSCLPAVSSSFRGEVGENAESVVLRLLDAKRVPLEVEKLGFSLRQSDFLKKMSLLENGLILVCGPTGAGKSTTAAALLNEIEKSFLGKKKIVTIEDPPEYVLSGMTQIRVDEKIGVGFDDALRLVFRQDPDVIFVGEIRDEKTALTVIRASLTGHLVIATLHTSDFFGAYARMRNLGVNFEELNFVLKGIVLQKLDFFVGEKNLNAKILDCQKCFFDFFETDFTEKNFLKVAEKNIL
ncbi:GspE/PulE family protein [Treponema zioleckii]|uniref:GspE/PulE family protein n=1 Tax=Treponema zioleckii TaxID=331680 RepID=UPI00168AD333|nr:ATPase, T2SS/T4P/T4SS family [Treponema zioleckii]